MAAYTPSLRLTLPVTGTDDGTWGDTVNNGITSLTDSSIAGTATVIQGDVANYTLTSNSGATDEARNMFLNITGALTAARNVICPTASKLYFIKNSTTGGFAVTLKTSGGSGISVPAGSITALYCDGTNVVDAITYANIPVINATTVDTTNLEVTNIKAKDGTASITLADTTGIATFSKATVISTTDNTNAALRVTQLGTGDALLVEDATNPDSTPFVVNNTGKVLIARTTASVIADAAMQINVQSATIPAMLTNTGSTSYRPHWSLTVADTEVASFGTTNTVLNTYVGGASRMTINALGGTTLLPATGAGAGLTVTGTNLSGSTTNYGVLSNITFGSAATTRGEGFQTILGTEAATFTLGELGHFKATQGTIGLNSVVTNQYGFNVASSLTGATNNYGFYSDLAAATGRFNFYASGTANNYFAGRVGISTTPATPAATLQVAGTTIISNVDMLNASYDSVSFSVSVQEIGPAGLFFSPDGTKMFVTGSGGDDVNEYLLSTPWVVSSAVYSTVFSVAGQDTAPAGLFFRDNGLQMYVIGQTNDLVYQYTLTTPWSIATAAYASKSFSIAGQETTPSGVFFKPDGLSMYIVGIVSDSISQYTLTTAWDVTTAVFLQSFSVTAQDTAPQDLFFTNDGTRMFVIGSTGDDINVYNLTTTWDISTAITAGAFSIAGQDQIPATLYVKPDGTKMYMLGQTNDTVYQYTVPSVEIQLTGTTSINGSATVAQDLTVNGSISGAITVNGITVGRGAGNLDTNTAVGVSALVANTTGIGNTAIGAETLRVNTTGYHNAALGQAALYSNTTGIENTALGQIALYSNISGVGNTAAGNSALFNATGNSNTAVGNGAGYYISTGAKNTILGRYDGNQGGLDIRTASNYIVLSDGDGNPRQIIDSSGNLGLGVTPSAWFSSYKAFQVNTNGSLTSNTDFFAVSNNAFVNAAGNDIYLTTGFAGRYRHVASNGAHQWYTAPSGTAGNAITFTQAMTLDASGQLGIGTTSPGYKLDVVLSQDGATRARINNQSSGTAASSGLLLDAYGGGWTIDTPASTTFANPLRFIFNTTERMRLDSSGNLGLGVTPSAWDAANKAFQVSSGSMAGNASGVSFSQNAYYNAGWKYIATATAAQYDQFQGSHRFFNAPSGTAGAAITFTQAMTLDSSGRLIIGATAMPLGYGTALNIYTAGVGARIYGTTEGTGPLWVDKQTNTSSTAQVFVQFSINTQSVANGQINGNGASQVAFGTFSDVRLKQNIVDLSPQLSNIMALRPVEFDYIESEGSGHQTGFIAQEIETVFSDVIGERADGMKTVTGWNKTEARLVKAIQEQQAIIEQQAAAITTLTARITALEAK